MTINQLEQYRSLRREMSNDEKRILELHLQKNNAKCASAILDIVNFIDHVEDSYLREIFKLRFIDGLTWLQIASMLGTSGDGSTERKCIIRYLEKEARNG